MFIVDRNRTIICGNYLVMAYTKLCNTTTIRRDADMKIVKNQTKGVPRIGGLMSVAKTLVKPQKFQKPLKNIFSWIYVYT